ncbi:MAG: glycosyltransferase family 39 protein [Chloroflexota bacterium]
MWWLEALFGACVAGLLWSGWFGLVLAHFGRFSLANVAAGSAVASTIGLVIWLRSRRTATSHRSATSVVPTSERRWIATAALALVLIIAAWLYRLPSESIIGDHDAGARMSSAVHLAETGTHYLRSPILPAANAQQLRVPRGVWSYCLYPAIEELLPDDPCRVQTPQFNGIYESWLALSYDLLGWVRFADVLPAALPSSILPATPLFLYFNPLLGLAAVIALYLVGRRLFGQAVALLGAVMLAVSFPQAYYSTTSMSEVPTQLVLLSAVWGLARFRSDEDAYSGAFAGVALGVALLVRPDVVVLHVLAAAWAIWSLITGRLVRRHAYFLIPVMVLFLHAALQYGHFASFYFWNNWEAMRGLYGLYMVVLSLCAVVIAAIIAVRRSLGAQIEALWWRLTGPRPRTLAFAALYGLFVWQSLLWPVLAQQSQLSTNSAGARAIFAPERGLEMLSWYLSPWVLIAAGAGLGLLVQRGIGWLRAPMIAAGALFTFILLVNPYVTFAHVFWVRRFVPEVLPLLMMCAAYCVVEVARLAPRRYSAVLGLGSAAFLVTSLIGTSLPLATRAPEYTGAVAQTLRLGALLPPNSIVLLEPSAAANWQALPLTLVFDQGAYLLPVEGKIDQVALAGAITDWRGQGQRVYVVAEEGESTLTRSQFTFQSVGQVEFLFPYLPQSFDRMPKGAATAHTSVHVYEVYPTGTAQAQMPFVLDIGAWDYGYMLSGGMESQRDGDVTYRSTASSATLVVPWPDARESSLALAVDSRRPTGAPPALLRVFVEDSQVGQVDFGGDQSLGFETYEFPVPPLIGKERGQAVVRLEVDSWVPAEYGYGDTRELGIEVDWVRVR